jgi:N-acetylneuraminate synthase
MATLGEVECALGVLAFGYLGGMEPPSPQRFEAAYASEAGRRQLETKVALLHCTTEYPAPFDEVNLRSMKTLHKAFGLSTGLSDHTAGIAIPIAAVALGARVIEKHFTLDSGLTGPDHKASLEPGELKAMVRSIREVESALGSPIKAPSPCELKNRELVRKSLVALRTIRKGEVFTAENLGVKRPGAGIPPARYWEFLGRQAVRDYKEDDFVVE